MVLRTQCEKWQDKVAVFVDSDKIEDDGTFLNLNSTAFITREQRPYFVLERLKRRGVNWMLHGKHFRLISSPGI